MHVPDSSPCAGELPLDLLAEVLWRAIKPRRWEFDAPSLKALCIVRAVSKSFRAAAELAVQSQGHWPLDLCLRDSDPVPAGLLDSALAAQAHELTLNLAEAGGLSRASGLSSYFQRSTQLTQVAVLAAGAASGAFVESALCTSTSITRLNATGWVPAQLPPQLRHLDVLPGRVASPDALELLLIRAAARCTALRSVTLTVLQMVGAHNKEGEEPQSLHLRGGPLGGLQLPCLQHLHLILRTFNAAALDLSWLRQPEPRSFTVSLSICGHDASWFGQREAVWEYLPGLLRPEDSLSIAIPAEEHWFTEADWEPLAHLRLQRFSLTLPAGWGDISILPQATSLNINFTGPSGTPCSIEWSSITRCPGHVMIRCKDAPLDFVRRFSGGAPAFAGEWTLHVAAQSYSGLPPANRGCSSAWYELWNVAALDSVKK